MKEYTNTYTKKIHDLLVPLVGEIVTQAVLKNQASSLGKDEESLSFIDGPNLAEKIKKGITIFVGSEVAEKVASQIINLR